MELSYNQLRKKEVVCVADGVNLGRVCDLAFLVPENRVKGYFVTGGKGFRFNRQPLFIPVEDIVKIGEDVILTGSGKKLPAPPKEQRPPKNGACNPPQCGRDGRRSYEEYE